MAENNHDLNTIEDSMKQYRESSKQKNKNTLASFESFYATIKKHTADHRHITLNNLKDIETRIREMHEKANRMKKTYFLHDEETIIDRQRVFEQTEERIRKENMDLLKVNASSADEGIQDLHALKSMLKDEENAFFEAFETTYLNSVTDKENMFNDYTDIAKQIDDVIEEHKESIFELFEETNQKIKKLDQSISQIIQEKNQRKNIIRQFISQRKKRYSAENVSFLEPNPTSSELNDIRRRKQNESQRYMKAFASEKNNIKKRFETRLKKIYNRQLKKKLQETAEKHFSDTRFFDDPPSKIRHLKRRIAEADRDKDKRTTGNLIKKLKKQSKWKSIKEKTIKEHNIAFVTTYKQYQTYYGRYLEKKHDRAHQVKMNLALFEELLEVDSFLAQIIAEQSTHIIHEELKWFDSHRLEREFQADIKSEIGILTTKNQINHLELTLTSSVKQHMIDQQLDINDVIVTMFESETNQKIKSLRHRESIEKEQIKLSKWIDSLTANVNHLNAKINLNRQMQNKINTLTTDDIRMERKQNVQYNDTKTEIERSLKKYDIETLGFKTLMENELNFLVMQASRADREETIHHEFILNTYKNRIRFAKDEFENADNEYELKINALLHAFDEEKNYHLEAIDRILETYDKKRRQIVETYEEFYYRQAHLLDQTKRSSIKRQLKREITEKKQKMETDLDNLSQKRLNDEELNRLEDKLKSLKTHYKKAFDDALETRDETKAKMKEIYDDAKERLETLEPYLKNMINPLDTLFFEQLDNLNKRYQSRLKKAEQHLDASTDALIEAYRKVHMTPNSDKMSASKKTDELRRLLKEKDRLKEHYKTTIEAIRTQTDQALNDLAEQTIGMINQCQNKLEKTTSIKNEQKVRLDEQKTTFKNEAAQANVNLDELYEQSVSGYEHDLMDTKKRHQQVHKHMKNRNHNTETMYKKYEKKARKDKQINHIFKTNASNRKKTWTEKLKTIKKETESLGFPIKTD